MSKSGIDSQTPDDATVDGCITVGDLTDDRIAQDDPRYAAGMAALGTLLEERIRRMEKEGGISIPKGKLTGYIRQRARDRER